MRHFKGYFARRPASTAIARNTNDTSTKRMAAIVVSIVTALAQHRFDAKCDNEGTKYLRLLRIVARQPAVNSRILALPAFDTIQPTKLISVMTITPSQSFR